MVEDTWHTQEKRWLEKIDAASRQGQEWVPTELHEPDQATRRSATDDLDALAEDGFVTMRMAQRNTSSGHLVAVRGVQLTGKGRRAIGRWPTEEGQVLAEVIGRLEELIDLAGAEDSEGRSRLQRALSSLRGIGRDGAINLGAAWLASRSGL